VSDHQFAFVENQVRNQSLDEGLELRFEFGPGNCGQAIEIGERFGQSMLDLNLTAV
jgi:hypothetical protein